MEDRKSMTHITAGLLIAALIVIFAIITNFLGLTEERGIGMIQYVIIIGGLIFFIHQYGKANNYFVSFGDLFAYGFKSTAVFTVIYIVFIVIFFLVFPDIKEKSLEIARQQMEKNGKLSETDIDRGVEMARKFFWVGVVGGSTIFLIIVGAIGSLIGAAVTKKRPHNPLEQLNA